MLKKKIVVLWFNFDLKRREEKRIKVKSLLRSEMNQAMLAGAPSIFYQEAEEDAAELRRQLQVRRSRMKRRMEQHCANLAFASASCLKRCSTKQNKYSAIDGNVAEVMYCAACSGLCDCGVCLANYFSTPKKFLIKFLFYCKTSNI